MNGMHGTVQIGRALMRGALYEISRWAAVYLAVVTILALGIWAAGGNWDATDDRARNVRSEMRLRTDHGTGCQYLESKSGALTPRLDTAGNQVCR